MLIGSLVSRPRYWGLLTILPDKRALPKWRYLLRQNLLPLVRWETPYLAYFQSSIRTPALDSYFAITANLGTHTFFMIGLPILFWCGFIGFGKGYEHVAILLGAARVIPKSLDSS